MKTGKKDIYKKLKNQNQKLEIMKNTGPQKADQ